MTTFTFGGGCFWCIDAVYRQLRGVISATSGYAGGHDTKPNYYRVLSGGTGHAEVVQIKFDENIIPPDVILDIFFLSHDPTTKDRQGNDVGPQYRSIMLHKDNSQKTLFNQAIKRAQDLYEDPIVTLVEPLDQFYPAESEHQDYFNKNPAAGYCSVIIAPKVSKVRATYSKWLTDRAF